MTLRLVDVYAGQGLPAYRDTLSIYLSITLLLEYKKKSSYPSRGPGNSEMNIKKRKIYIVGFMKI